MKAIFEDRNKQYTASVGDSFAIDKMVDVEMDSSIEFDNVLLVKDDDNKTKIGAPYVTGAKVKAKIVNPYIRDQKVEVFKFKRRKNYKRLKGHKQPYTIIMIEEITA